MEYGEVIMIWLLIVVYLGGDPVSVVNADIAKTFQSEQRCMKEIAKIPKNQIPPNVNMGCVPLTKKVI